MSLETGKTISEVTEWVNVEGQEVLSWKFMWRRELFEWEKEQFGQLITIMNAIRWKRGPPDKKLWGAGFLGEYIVGAGYRVLNENESSSGNKWFRDLCSLKVVGSAQVCVWRAMLEKLPTRLNLEKRGVVVISNLCPFVYEG